MLGNNCHFSECTTPTLLMMLALSVELEMPAPVDLIIQLNTRGVIIDFDRDFETGEEELA